MGVRPVPAPGGAEDGLARVLVVCTADVTRSPMAAMLLEAFLRRAVGPERTPVVTSAGTHAREGDPADPPMAAIARRWGLDPDEHRSRPVSGRAVAGQDLVLTMEQRHRDVVLRSGAWLAPRTFTFTEAAALVDAAPTEALPVGEGVGALAAVLHDLRSGAAVDAADVGDPHGRDEEEYRATAWELARLVERVGPALAAAVRP